MLNEFQQWLEDRKGDSARKSDALAGEGRQDEAILERIRGNVFGIFVSVTQAAMKNANGEDVQAAFFERNLANIPTNWRTALDRAIARDDAVEIAKEEAKLAALGEIEDAYKRLRGEGR